MRTFPTTFTGHPRSFSNRMLCQPNKPQPHRARVENELVHYVLQSIQDVVSPLSKITAASLDDTGYVVNAAAVRRTRNPLLHAGQFRSNRSNDAEHSNFIHGPDILRSSSSCRGGNHDTCILLMCTVWSIARAAVVPYNLHNPGSVSWIGLVPYRSRTPSHSGRSGSR